MKKARGVPNIPKMEKRPAIEASELHRDILYDEREESWHMDANIERPVERCCMTYTERVIEKCCEKSEKLRKELISENERLLATLKSLPSQQKIPVPKMLRSACNRFTAHAIKDYEMNGGKDKDEPEN